MINIRRFSDGDEKYISEIIKDDILENFINDYPQSSIKYLLSKHTGEFIKNRAEKFHMYVLSDENSIVGTGTIGPYWGKEKESALFTIFIDPRYKGKGLGRKIIETLEQDKFYKRAIRVEVASSIPAVGFYMHFGYNFKKFGNIVNQNGEYVLEKFPRNESITLKKQIKYNLILPIYLFIPYILIIIFIISYC